VEVVWEECVPGARRSREASILSPAFSLALSAMTDSRFPQRFLARAHREGRLVVAEKGVDREWGDLREGCSREKNPSITR